MNYKLPRARRQGGSDNTSRRSRARVLLRQFRADERDRRAQKFLDDWCEYWTTPNNEVTS